MGGDFSRRVAIYSLATSPVIDDRNLLDRISSSRIYRAGKGGVLRRKKTDINHE
jgi:hypothetical protein